MRINTLILCLHYVTSLKTKTTSTCWNCRWNFRGCSSQISRDFDAVARSARVSWPLRLRSWPWRHRCPLRPATLWSSLWSEWFRGQRSRPAPSPRCRLSCTPRPVWNSPSVFAPHTRSSHPRRPCVHNMLINHQVNFSRKNEEKRVFSKGSRQ